MTFEYTPVCYVCGYVHASAHQDERCPIKVSQPVLWHRLITADDVRFARELKVSLA